MPNNNKDNPIISNLQVPVYGAVGSSDAQPLLERQPRSTWGDYFTRLKNYINWLAGYLTWRNVTLFSLGGVGTLAGVLYLAPSYVCVKQADCGLWLANFVSPDVAQPIVFISGASGYSGSNAYFSAYSVSRFIEFLRQTKSAKTKGVIIVIMSVVGLAPIVIATLATGSNLLETILSIAGAFPGILYSTVEMAKIEVPYYYSKSMRLWDQSRLKKSIFSRTPEQRLSDVTQGLYRKHYDHQQKNFLKNLSKNLKKITVNAHQIILTDYNANQDITLFFKLANRFDDLRPASLGSKAVDKIGTGIGFLLTTNFSIPIFLATMKVLGQQVTSVNTEDEVSITAIMSVMVLYANYKVGIPGGEALMMILKNILSCQTRQFDSMIFMLRPLFTVTTLLTIMFFTALSYSVIAMISDQNYDGPAQDEFRYGAIVGIDLYHTFALFLFVKLLMSQFTSNVRDKQLLKLEQDESDLSWQTAEDFAEMVEAMSETDRNVCQVEKFIDYYADNNESDLESNGAVSPSLHPVQGDGFSSWWSNPSAFVANLSGRSPKPKASVEIEVSSVNSNDSAKNFLS